MASHSNLMYELIQTLTQKSDEELEIVLNNLREESSLELESQIAQTSYNWGTSENLEEFRGYLRRSLQSLKDLMIGNFVAGVLDSEPEDLKVLEELIQQENYFNERLFQDAISG